MALFCVVAANAADLDFIPGIFLGNPNAFHRGISHSIGAALLYGVLAAVFVRMGTSRPALFGVAAGLYLSHVLLDYFNSDSRPPYGEPLLWPASARYYVSPFTPLLDIRRDASSGLVVFFTSLFSVHNLSAICLELLFLAPIGAALFLMRWRTAQ